VVGIQSRNFLRGCDWVLGGTQIRGIVERGGEGVEEVKNPLLRFENFVLIREVKL